MNHRDRKQLLEDIAIACAELSQTTLDESHEILMERLASKIRLRAHLVEGEEITPWCCPLQGDPKCECKCHGKKKEITFSRAQVDAIDRWFGETTGLPAVGVADFRKWLSAHTLESEEKK